MLALLDHQETTRSRFTVPLLQNFLGGMDEEWFILVHVEIEAKAAPFFPAILEAQKAVHENNVDALTGNLTAIARTLRQIYKTLQRMPERLWPICDEVQHQECVVCMTGFLFEMPTMEVVKERIDRVAISVDTLVNRDRHLFDRERVVFAGFEPYVQATFEQPIAAAHVRGARQVRKEAPHRGAYLVR